MQTASETYKFFSWTKSLTIIAITVMHMVATDAAAQIPVIPGAVGHGVNTRAGRGGTIYRVQNLNESGSGSLAACVAATGPRICVFEISGTINLSRHLTIRNPFITIAGQTAPSPGITLRGAGLTVFTHDVLVQHIRIRPGDHNRNVPSTSHSALTIGAAEGAETYNVVIDHVTTSWAIDQVMTLWTDRGVVRDVTIRNSFINEGLHDSWHEKGPHSMGLIIGRNVRRVTVVDNLMAFNNGRNPLIRDDTQDIIVLNNLVYRPGTANTSHMYIGSRGGRNLALRATFAGNELIPFPGDNNHVLYVHRDAPSDTRIYAEDNGGPRESNDPFSTINLNGRSVSNVRLNSPSPWVTGLMMRDTNLVENYVTTYAGARPTDRDAVDRRIVTSIRNRTGNIINSPSQGGGYPTLASNRRTLSLPSSTADRNGNGYTDLEEALHDYAAQVEGTRSPASPAPTPTPTPPPATSTTVFSTVDSYLGDSRNWTPLTASRWRITSSGSPANNRYSINTSSYNNLSGSRLGEYSLINGRTYTDFDFRATVRSSDNLSTNTGADYVVVFGYRDANNYNYVMFSENVGGSQVFKIVNGNRIGVGTAATRAAFSDNNFHNIRVQKTGNVVSAYIDNTLLVQGTDSGYGSGRAGIGSFNDMADFDDIQVTATSLSPTVFSTVDSYLGDASNWTPLTSSRWSITQTGSNTRYAINTTNYANLSGSRLGEYSLINGRTYTDFNFRAVARSSDDLATNTGADFCIVFGYRDANNYSYVMFSENVGGSQIFKIVNGNRVGVGTAATRPAFTDTNFHNIRVQKTGNQVSVYIDNTLLMQGSDSAFGSGRIGVGSFNDRAEFDDVQI